MKAGWIVRDSVTNTNDRIKNVHAFYYFKCLTGRIFVSTPQTSGSVNLSARGDASTKRDSQGPIKLSALSATQEPCGPQANRPAGKERSAHPIMGDR